MNDASDVLIPVTPVVQPVENNAGLAFEYAMDYLRMAKAAAGSLNVRLGTVIGFAGLALRFALDLPVDGCLSCLLLKAGVCGLAIIAMGFGLWGIYPFPVGKIVRPEVLLEDDWYRESGDRVRCALVDALSVAAAEIGNMNYVKSMRLRLAVGFLAALAVIFGIDVILLGFVDFYRL